MSEGDAALAAFIDRIKRLEGALANAAENIFAVARGSVVQIFTKGGYAIQNRLSGERRRQTVPDAEKPIPPAIVAALEEAAHRAWQKLGF